MIDRTNGTRGFVRKRAHECSSTRALEPSHSKTTRALELLHSSTRALELEKYSHTTRMTSANHSREFFHSRISSTRPVLYIQCTCTCTVYTCTKKLCTCICNGARQASDPGCTCMQYTHIVLYNVAYLIENLQIHAVNSTWHVTTE